MEAKQLYDKGISVAKISKMLHIHKRVIRKELQIETADNASKFIGEV